MKIAILGTRGIPNNYGGFEQFAEYLSVFLVKRDHEVTVYNPHYHYYSGNYYNGVEIKKKYSPEKLIGASANYIYDFLCLKDALKNKFDIIIECGAASASLSYYLCKINNSKILTNPDGLEWKRKKWSLIGKRIVKLSEKLAIKKSPYVIADHPEIQKYISNDYSKESNYIPYGAEIPENYDEKILKKLGIHQNEYSLIIARLTPENNIKTIIEGYLASKIQYPLIIVGLTKTTYAKYLKNKFKKYSHIKFIGSIYDILALNSLRHYSKIYFHGHSVGGTNPSLLEAMACGSFIIAHDNLFNKKVLKTGGLYFKNENELINLLKDINNIYKCKSKFIQENRENITANYNWDSVIDRYENLFNKLK